MQRVPPKVLFARYGRLARRAGLDKLYLVLSFDCDTLEDADVAVAVHDRLRERGVLASYAVPGQILEQGASAYREIAATGAEFLNHGYLIHTVKRNDRYVSTLFYDEMSPEAVRVDIVAGAAAVRSVVDQEPRGFRVPHFGTYQRKGQLRFLHELLASLGYAYSSSTTPQTAFRRGPLFADGGIYEIPVSGTASRPLDILDSWSFFAEPGRPEGRNEYAREGSAVAGLFSAAGAGILSFYADPSQIHDQDAFFDTVARWCEIAEPTTYGELVARFG